MDWQGIWNDIVNFFSTNIWNIVFFFATLFIGIILIKIIINITRRILGKTKMEKIAQQFLVGIVKVALYLVLVLILLSQVGVQITGILTTVSALVLAVGVALEGNIANLANGIVIISTHMFKKGDYIMVDGVEGNITDINFLFTTLMTVDNKKITLPNSTIVNNHVVNLGANPKRRVDFTFSVAYESDVEKVKKIIIDVMKSDGRVYLDPEPFCRLKVLNASSLDFVANCWVDSEDYWDTYYYVVENVYNELKRNNISVPYNQLEIRERKDNVTLPIQGSKLPERIEKERKVAHNKFDLENADFTSIFKHKKKDKKNKKDKNNKKDKKLKDTKQVNNSLAKDTNKTKN